MDYGMKVSQVGYDVKTADPVNLSLRSDFTLLKVFASGSTTVTDSSVLTIAHNLGYTPQFVVYIDLAENGKMVMLSSVTSFSLFSVPVGSAFADDTNLYIYFTDTGSGTTSAYYYIFHEQL